MFVGERPFKCWICGTAFRRKDNLDRHIKNTHNQPKEVAKQLANDAAAEYLLINASSPVPVSKVNSAVISNVIRTAQLNSPTTSKTLVKEKKSVKSTTTPIVKKRRSIIKQEVNVDVEKRIESTTGMNFLFLLKKINEI